MSVVKNENGTWDVIIAGVVVDTFASRDRARKGQKAYYEKPVYATKKFDKTDGNWPVLFSNGSIVLYSTRNEQREAYNHYKQPIEAQIPPVEDERSVIEAEAPKRANVRPYTDVREHVENRYAIKSNFKDGFWEIKVNGNIVGRAYMKADARRARDYMADNELTNLRGYIGNIF